MPDQSTEIKQFFSPGRNNLLKGFILFAGLSILNSCARWKVEHLKPSETIMIPFGDKIHEILVTRNDKGIFNTPTEIALDSDNYYIADKKGAKILIISRDNGEVKEIIANKEQLTQKNSVSVNESQGKKNQANKSMLPGAIDSFLQKKNLGPDNQKIVKSGRHLSKKSKNMIIHNAPLVYPGKIHIMPNNYLLVQNCIPVKSSFSNKTGINNALKKEYIPETAPSHILIFNEQRKIIGKLYRNKEKNIPFKQVMNLHNYENKEIIIISRESPKTWFIQSFNLSNLTTGLNITVTPDFILKKDNIKNKKDYFLFIENIIPRYNKQEFLISVAFYKDSRFKFRRILLLNASQGSHPSQGSQLSLYTELQEPQNELYASLENNSTYLWSSESYHEIKLKIYNASGDLINNKKIKLFGKDEAWRNFIPLPNGNIISLYVSRVGMEIIIWS